MVLLPIVERELRIAARLPSTYRNRAIAAGVTAVAAIVMLLLGDFLQSATMVGGAMFTTLTCFTFAYCALEGVRKTSDCLSEERRDGTLGLLFLTDLKGYDVILGKLAATSLNSMYGLLAILPTLALSMLLGGVTAGEFWRMALALANLLFFSLCVGMWVSSWTRLEYKAMARTLLIILCVGVAPFFIGWRGLYQMTPAGAVHSAFANRYPTWSSVYWQSLGTTQLVSWGLLALASFMIQRSWQEADHNRPAWSWLPRRRRDREWKRTEARNTKLDINPIFWLAERKFEHRTYAYLLLLAGIINAVAFVINAIMAHAIWPIEVYVAASLIINFMMKALIAAQACHCLAEARRTDSLEMMLATPLMVQQIIYGQILAIKDIFVTPVAALFAVEIAGAFLGVSFNSKGPTEPSEGLGMAMAGALLLGLFMLDAVAVTWAGMWFGLSSKKEGQAMTKTILYVLVAPLFSLFLSCFGVPLFLGVPIFWMVWSQNKLPSELRRMAESRYSGRPATPPPIPPVIAPPFPPVQGV